jgi:hypothetical protein
VPQRESGLAQALDQRRCQLAKTGRKQLGWTVNPSAYAYTGSNPVPATKVVADQSMFWSAVEGARIPLHPTV